MTELEKEAKEYCDNSGFYHSEIFVSKVFIAGAKSNTVEQMLLKAIELARTGDEDWKGYINPEYTKKEILEKVKKEFYVTNS